MSDNILELSVLVNLAGTIVEGNVKEARKFGRPRKYTKSADDLTLTPGEQQAIRRCDCNREAGRRLRLRNQEHQEHLTRQVCIWRAV